MIENATTKMLSLEDVAYRLNVSKRSVEVWVEEKAIASFKIDGHRRISEESLTRFVLLHTLNPQRPDWLTAKLESDCEAKRRAIQRLDINDEVERQLNVERGRRNAELERKAA